MAGWDDPSWWGFAEPALPCGGEVSRGKGAVVSGSDMEIWFWILPERHTHVLQRMQQQPEL